MKNYLHLVSSSFLFVLLLGSFQSPLLGQAYANIVQRSEADGLKNQAQPEDNPVQPQAKLRSVRAVLFALEESFHVSFNYDDALVGGFNLNEDFSWKREERLEQVLKRLTEKANLKFEKIDEENYIIFSAKKKPTDAKRFETSLRTVPENLDSSSSLSAFAQLLTEDFKVIDLQVSGTVRDESANPLPGVNVILKGTTSGTTTDSEGKYALSVPDGDGILVFSFIGYKSQEVSINNRVAIDVDMMPDVKSLQEVVVVGYGEQKKIHLTGAVEVLDVSEVEDLPAGNLGAALAGRVLGVSVSGGNTRPGSVSRLLVRNAQTLSKDGGNTDPLFVIDGVIQIGADGTNDATVFNNMDASEVESISFLKDASAAIYGSRGSNGVVIITTKRGKEGKPRISYNGMFGFNDEAYRTKMLSAHEYGVYYNIMNGPYGANETAGDEDYFFSQDELEHFKTINHDWLEEAWSPATSMRHNLNVSGGTEKATFFANASYYTQEGNLSSLDYDRWNFRAGADMKVANNLKAGLQVAGFYSDRIKTFNKIGGENEENDYKNLLKAPRYVPMYIDGYPVKPPGSGSSKSIANYHFFEIERLGNLATNRDQYMTLNVFAEYEVPFVEGLKARASYGRNMGSGRGTQIGTSYTLYEFDRLGTNGHIYEGAQNPEGGEYINGDRVYFSNRHALSYQANLTLSYAKDFGRHSVSGMFTAERGESESSQEDVLKEQPSQSTTGHFGTAFGEIDGKTDFDEAGSMSYAGRANWSYADKYLAEFLFRSDASTKFAPEYYWGKFYSGSVGWVISNEEFYNSNVVSFLKLRYSVGLLGQDDTRAWQWRQRYTFQGGKGAVFGGDEDTSTGMRMEASPNRDATWSDELKNNLGIEARFMKNRLSTTVELFYDKGTRILLEETRTVPITVGGTVAAENFGELNAFGYEVALGWNDEVGDFRYGIDTRFTWYDTKWKVGDFSETAMLYPWEPRPGRSEDNGVWGWDYLGMFKDQEEVDAYVEEYNIEQVFETPMDELKPGMLYYRDIRGPLQADGTFAAPDGIIDDNDQVQLARREGNLYGYGMTLKFGYKSLSFDCVIAGSFGGWSEMDRTKLENEINDSYQSVPVFWNNIYDPILNPGGIYPNPHHEDISLNPTSVFWRVNDFRMRVVSFNINYSLPSQVASALRLNNARVYLSAMNPLNLYNPFDYKDSEGSFDTFPVLRTFALGLNLSL